MRNPSGTTLAAGIHATSWTRKAHAFDMFYGKAAEMAHPRKIGVVARFDCVGRRKFEILEQFFLFGGDEVATLLIFEGEKMLEIAATVAITTSFANTHSPRPPRA